MGPAIMPDNSLDTYTSSVFKIEKLLEDGSNWNIFKEHMETAFTRRKLMRHVRGTARKPAVIKETADGKWFKDGADTAKDKPLTDEEIEKLETEWEEYSSKEATVREMVFQSIPPLVISKLRSTTSAKELWAELVNYQQIKSVDVHRELLRRMRALRCPDGADPDPTLTKMSNYYERLKLMGVPIEDATFAADIRAAMPPSYRQVLH
ncbi:hypothetical protein FA95DRAFT_1471215, partial [Auriscalpium vulgare]